MSKVDISLGGHFAFFEERVALAGTGKFSESSVTTMNARPWAEHAPRRDHWAIGRVRPPWYSEVLAYLDDPVVRVFARSPHRILQDLRLAEVVYRDACEEGRQSADVLAICNDLRDELALDVCNESHWPQRMHDSEIVHDFELNRPTTSAASTPWGWEVAPGARIRDVLLNRIHDACWNEPKISRHRIGEIVRDTLAEYTLELTDVTITTTNRGVVDVDYRARHVRKP